MKKYIIGLDEGTTSCRTVLYDVTTNEIVDISNRKFKSIYPHEAWVEQDAENIFKLQKQTLTEILGRVNEDEVIGLGITNQRETVVAWNKKQARRLLEQ